MLVLVEALILLVVDALVPAVELAGGHQRDGWLDFVEYVES